MVLTSGGGGGGGVGMEGGFETRVIIVCTYKDCKLNFLNGFVQGFRFAAVVYRQSPIQLLVEIR